MERFIIEHKRIFFNLEICIKLYSLLCDCLSFLQTHWEQNGISKKRKEEFLILKKNSFMRNWINPEMFDAKQIYFRRHFRSNFSLKRFLTNCLNIPTILPYWSRSEGFELFWLCMRGQSFLVGRHSHVRETLLPILIFHQLAVGVLARDTKHAIVSLSNPKPVPTPEPF